eukprot:scaffold30087_cov63-Phaeocystis_antarctica.AAC.2
MSTRELTGEYPFLLVMQLPGRPHPVVQTIDHDQLAGKDFIAIRNIVDDLADNKKLLLKLGYIAGAGISR